MCELSIVIPAYNEAANIEPTLHALKHNVPVAHEVIIVYDFDEDNLVVACNKCNARKGSRQKDMFLKENPPRPVKGKRGEPRYWDGLASVFVVLARESQSRLTRNEKAWLRELEKYMARAKGAGAR